MIILKVTGGLGNQMFQIAFAKRLAEEYNQQIYIDTSVYKKYKIRDFSLSNLNISEDMYHISEAKLSIKNVIYYKVTQKLYHVSQKLIRIFGLRELIGKKLFNFLIDRGLYYNFDPYHYRVPFKKHENICVYGYFQSEKYYETIKGDIIESMKVNVNPTKDEQDLLNEIESSVSVGISMRLGDDYRKSKSLYTCNKEYYLQAMDSIYEVNNNVTFYVFSDDINRAKSEFNFKYPVKFIEGFNDYQSLRLLYTCKHFIISNSSFSWWGAYLSNNEEKVIIAPSVWNKLLKMKPDIYTNNMKIQKV